MQENKYFKSIKIAENITRIFGLTGELMHLIGGSKKAALIDTGTGNIVYSKEKVNM